VSDDKDRKIQDLESAIKIQANAWKTLEAAENLELNRLRKQEFMAGQALRQLDSERGMNAFLTGEVEGLRSRLGAEAADERAKIVAWLKAPLIRLNNFDGFFRASDLATAEDLDDAATKIEAGEHLK
jgi:hypothetical protein